MGLGRLKILRWRSVTSILEKMRWKQLRKDASVFAWFVSQIRSYPFVNISSNTSHSWKNRVRSKLFDSKLYPKRSILATNIVLLRGRWISATGLMHLFNTNRSHMASTKDTVGVENKNESNNVFPVKRIHSLKRMFAHVCSLKISRDRLEKKNLLCKTNNFCITDLHKLRELIG